MGGGGGGGGGEGGEVGGGGGGGGGDLSNDTYNEVYKHIDCHAVSRC